MTRKKAGWVGNRKTTLRSVPLKANQASSDRGAREAQKQVRKMHLDVSKQVNALFETNTAKNSVAPKPGEIKVAMDASIASQSSILMNKLRKKWNKTFGLFSKNFTQKMISNVTTQSGNDVKRASEKLSGGLSINTNTLSARTKDKITAATNESASLIKTISSSYMDEVTESISRSISSNTGSFTSLKESINSTLQGKYKTYRNKAKNIALDQTQKAYSNIAASRMQDVGLDEYVWHRSGGAQKPNQYHVHALDGNTYKLSDPPIIDPKTGTKGKPGDWYGCKCFMEPVISFG